MNNDFLFHIVINILCAYCELGNVMFNPIDQQSFDSAASSSFLFEIVLTVPAGAN